jgi:MFS family permease
MVAPILAGFAFAILVLVLVPPAKNETDPLRWRDPVLALLVAAALLLIISTQAAIRARMTMLKPDELTKWYPSAVDQNGKPNLAIRTRQRDLNDRTAKASNICRQTYNAGVLLLFTSIAVLLVPPSPVDDARRAVILVALVAVAIEAAWLTGTSLRTKQLMARLPVLITPASYAIGAFVILRFTTSAYASQAAAAAGIAIAGAAAAAAGWRLTFNGAAARFRIIGIAILLVVVGAACTGVALLAHWRHAALAAEITAAALVIFLAVAIIPKDSLQE